RRPANRPDPSRDPATRCCHGTIGASKAFTLCTQPALHPAKGRQSQRGFLGKAWRGGSSPSFPSLTSQITGNGAEAFLHSAPHGRKVVSGSAVREVVTGASPRDRLQ